MRDPALPPADPVLVTADDREPETVLAALRDLPGVQVTIQRLKMGDYQVDGRLLVERKTLPDFALSIVDGRLFTQATRLTAAKIPAALLLEGSAADLAATGVRREALQGALVSLALVFDLPILRSQNPEETARIMLYAATQMRAAATGGLTRPGRRPKGKLRTQLRILQGLPGIGPERAQRLLDAFGNVEAVLKADTEALQDISGIGAKTAQAIRWAVSEAAEPYVL
jgi:ERCC4-type nuclease